MKLARLIGTAATASMVAALSIVPTANAVTPNVGFLDSASGQGPELTPTTVTLTTAQNGANLLVAIIIADGPDNVDYVLQQAVIKDNRNHLWTKKLWHLVFGTVIEVFTTPGTGHDAGTVVTSTLMTHKGDEGQEMTIAAYANGKFASTNSKNGSYGIPQLHITPAQHTDTYTAFADGKHNRPITLVPGFHAVNVDRLGTTTSIDHDLYEISHLNSHDWPGGTMLTGNTGPVASPYWGIVDVNIVPAA